MSLKNNDGLLFLNRLEMWGPTQFVSDILASFVSTISNLTEMHLILLITF